MNLSEHLAGLDHGQLANILGDARLVELLSAVAKSRVDLAVEDRGRTILDVIGGPVSILENSNLRRAFFLTFSSKERKSLARHLSVDCIDTFKLTKGRRKNLYSWFDLTAPEKEIYSVPPAVSLIGVEYGLFPHQTAALLKCREYLEGDPPRVMLHMPTGSGKTRTAMHLISRHLNSTSKGLVLWLVAGRELCDQAACEFQSAWRNLGERSLPLICAWEGRRAVDFSTFVQVSQSAGDPKRFEECIWPEDLDDGLIVGSLDTIWSMIQTWEPGEVLRRTSHISLVVFDEAHRSAATTYKLVVETVATAAGCGLLGLSATPGRSHYKVMDGTTVQLVDLFGKRMVQLEVPGYDSPVEALIDQGYLARLGKERLDIANSGLSKGELRKLSKRLESALDVPPETLRYLGLNSTRNLQIIERIERLVLDEGHRRVIAFTPSVESAELIASVLKSRGILSASVTATTDSFVRETTIAQFKSSDEAPYVLCNYGVLSTGFDAPKTSAVVIARPTLSIVLLNQMAGRAIRGPLVGGNKSAVLITVVDTSIPELVDTVEQFHAFDDSWKN